jgi:hypothetical protein
MYDLYKAKCTAEEIIPASSITYRRVFCNEFNFSFHKLKKTLGIQNSFQVKGCCIHRLVDFSPFFVMLLFFTCPLFGSYMAFRESDIL